MERALCHIREAFVGLNDGQARSVEQLVNEQAAFERLMKAAMKKAGDHTKSLAPTDGAKMTR